MCDVADVGKIPASPVYNPTSPQFYRFPPCSPSSTLPSHCNEVPCENVIPEQTRVNADFGGTTSEVLSASIFTQKTTTHSLILKFSSIEEKLFNRLLLEFRNCPVQVTQSLSRSVIVDLMQDKGQTVWPIDKLYSKRSWFFEKCLTKAKYTDESHIALDYALVQTDENAKLPKTMFNEDILPISHLTRTSFVIDIFWVDIKILSQFQKAQETTIRWTKQDKNVVHVLEKIIHKNGRYDYGYVLQWNLANLKHTGDSLGREISIFEKSLRNHTADTIGYLMDDLHKRQMWCDNMLTLKPVRNFKVHNTRLENIATSRGILVPKTDGQVEYIANKLDGERCFGFLSSNGLLVITSTTLVTIKDIGMANLKQMYYVVVEKLPNDDFVLIDVVFILRYSANLNPVFTSNNKMFETNLHAIEISILDSIRFIRHLPCRVIKKNIFVASKGLQLCSVPAPDAGVTCDGMLIITKSALHKVKKNQTLELEICLRSLLLQKLHDNKLPLMHKFLKQWKKRKIIVAQDLFATFQLTELRHLYGHLYLANKEKYNLTEVLWGDYYDNPKRFVLDHFSANRQLCSGRIAKNYLAETNEVADGMQHSSVDVVPVLEILNTRAVVEFKCIHHCGDIKLEYLRNRHDKLQPDSVFKAKNIINSMRKMYSIS